MTDMKRGLEGDVRGWDGWMASPTRWTWVWALVCCRLWGLKESDTTEGLNWTESTPEHHNSGACLLLMPSPCAREPACCRWVCEPRARALPHEQPPPWEALALRQSLHCSPKLKKVYAARKTQHSHRRKNQNEVSFHYKLMKKSCT